MEIFKHVIRQLVSLKSQITYGSMVKTCYKAVL